MMLLFNTPNHRGLSGTGRSERLRTDLERQRRQAEALRKPIKDETSMLLGCLSKLLWTTLAFLGVAICAVISVIVPLRMLFEF